jgi:hypothetical protein
MRKPSKKESLYLSWRKESDITWRQFWESIQGKQPHWMNTNQYGGEWLDKKMSDPI